MAIDALFRPDGPWLHPVVAADKGGWDILESLQKRSELRVAARVVRGNKMRTTPAFFDEFAAAFQFPAYFGENWDAFDECVTDLSWLPADVYTVLLTDSVHLLEAEPSEDRALGIRVLERAGREWGKPIGGEFAPARPFHVLLQCTPAEERSLCETLATAKAAFRAIALA